MRKYHIAVFTLFTFLIFTPHIFGQLTLTVTEYGDTVYIRKVGFFSAVLGGYATATYNQSFSVENTAGNTERYSPRTVSFMGSYAFGKKKMFGFFGNGAYLYGGTKGIGMVAIGPQLTFDVEGGTIGEQVGETVASVRIAFGVGVRSGAITKNQKYIGHLHIIGISERFNLHAEFWGSEGMFWFYGRSTGKLFSILRLGIQAEKYPETTALVGPLVEGEFSFNRYASLRAGATVGAQVQKNRFHWGFGFNINGAISF